MSSIENFKIRDAVVEDSALIHNFIFELAEYEKMTDKVTSTPEMIREEIFGKRMAEVLIAEEQGEAVGFALFFHNFSTFSGKPGLYLEDLYIKPEKRGKGYGKKMLQYIARLAYERGWCKVEWSCLDWNEGALRFYKNMGAQAMNEWVLHRLSGNELQVLGEDNS